MPERKSKKHKAILGYYDVIETYQTNTQHSIKSLVQYIELKTLPPQTKCIQNYIRRGKQRKNIITTKIKGQRILTRLLQKWQTHKLEHDARQLQQEADNGNMIPISRYQIGIKRSKNRTETTFSIKQMGPKPKHH